jgi:sugar phosphate isomerase/epimerase
MNADRIELLGSYWTLAGGAYPHTDHEYSRFDFASRVEAAAKAGFKGIGIWHADLSYTLETSTLAEMKRVLDANGITHVELEFLTDWFQDGERKQASDRQKKLLFEAAEALEARHVKVGDFFGEPCPISRLIESFAALCREAAERGTNILFELMPFANVHTLDDAIALVEGASADNGGIILDLWHVVKLGIPFQDLRRIQPRYLLGVELNDGSLGDSPDMRDETINHRRLCGEGEFDVRGFIDVVQDIGFTGPWGIEVLSAELREQPLEQIVRRAYETTIAQFSA